MITGEQLPPSPLLPPSSLFMFFVFRFFEALELPSAQVKPTLKALTMLTGYATERILLHRYREHNEADELQALAAIDPKRAKEIAAARAKLSPEQEQLRARAREEEMAEREHADVEIEGTDSRGATELRDPVRLVKLRNPAGVSAWAGPWGPRSSLWTHEVLFNQVLLFLI
ncbi:hypothetical protein T492DRAFT_834974 [Pavlovales sp. CCMP2436]|nr:hypothetical protein T492DRAFT_834974 [Pavlovales sp. CCMP2436]